MTFEGSCIIILCITSSVCKWENINFFRCCQISKYRREFPLPWMNNDAPILVTIKKEIITFYLLLCYLETFGAIQ